MSITPRRFIAVITNMGYSYEQAVYLLNNAKTHAIDCTEMGYTYQAALQNALLMILSDPDEFLCW